MSMTHTKADISHKIANDCRSMKNEAAEIIEKLQCIIKKRP